MMGKSGNGDVRGMVGGKGFQMLFWYHFAACGFVMDGEGGFVFLHTRILNKDGARGEKGRYVQHISIHLYLQPPSSPPAS